MSIKIMQEVWDHAPVDQGTLLVLLALADSADEASRTCYPGIEALSHRSRLSERQVQYCLKRLRESGVIAVRRNASPVKTNLYRIEEISRWAIARDAIIAPHATKPETQSATSRDEVDCVSETKPTAPEPSVTSVEPSESCHDLFSANGKPVEDTPKVDLFEEAWKAYPHNPGRRDKKAARTRFWSIVHRKVPGLEVYPTAEQLIGAVKAYAASKPDNQYVPALDGWLNRSKWVGFLVAPTAAADNPFRRMIEQREARKAQQKLREANW